MCRGAIHSAARQQACVACGRAWHGAQCSLLLQVQVLAGGKRRSPCAGAPPHIHMLACMLYWPYRRGARVLACVHAGRPSQPMHLAMAMSCPGPPSHLPRLIHQHVVKAQLLAQQALKHLAVHALGSAGQRHARGSTVKVAHARHAGKPPAQDQVASESAARAEKDRGRKRL